MKTTFRRRSDRIATSLLVLLLALMAACHRENRKIAVSEIANPALPGSICPNETTIPDGGVLLSWLEPSNDGLALRFAIRRGEGWSSPQTIVTRKNFDKYAEAPPWVLMLPNQSLVAVWAEQLPPGKGKWPGNFLLSAVSSDEGRNWSPSVPVHSDRTDGEHSFASLAVKDNDHAAIVWLDSRDYGAKNTYRLMSAVVDGSGAVSGETTVDDNVCTCCPTSMVQTKTGLLAVYRNRTQQEIRDTFLVREQNGKWQPGQPLGNESWHINGCPVNGPVLAKNGNQVVAVWFTGMEKQASVKAAFSEDGGVTFGEPSLVDRADENSDVLGRTSVAMLDSGEALVSWIRKQDGKSKLVIARLRANNQPGEHQVVADGATDRLGYPHMQKVNKDGVLVSWGGGSDAKVVRTSLILTR